MNQSISQIKTGDLPAEMTAQETADLTLKVEVSDDLINEETLRNIKQDITDAQQHEIPKFARRGLSMDTLRHFHCGYLTEWNHPKTRAEEKYGKREKLPPTSQRIIVPTLSGEHYNAILPEKFRNKSN